MIRVVSAAESAARDRAAIAAGIPSRALMRCAGTGAAGVIARRYPQAMRRGVAVFAGPGNNGGDGWVVAGALATAGVAVRVVAVGDPKPGSDAAAERAAALPLVTTGAPVGDEGLIVDGLLGTGASGAPRGAIADAAKRITELRSRGAIVVSLDVPTGLDATTGAIDASAIAADLTITFGAIKRGLLVARAVAGEIVLVDIGLGAHAALDDGAPALVDVAFVRAHVPPIPADAHKGVRRRVAIVAGGPGMAGAAILASRAALASGAGLVRLFVAPENVPVVQTAAYEALASPWPESDREVTQTIAEWADAVLLGPGLGLTDAARAVADRVLRGTQRPAVLDADGLGLFAGRASELGGLLAGRPAVITPHVREFGRLAQVNPNEVLVHRFEIGRDLARTLGATVLLKGVPTVVTSPTGDRLVSATGTPVLATGGSGDILSGIAITLLAQTADPFASAASAAWLHGRAAELATDGRAVRGLTLENVFRSLPDAWRLREEPVAYPVLAHLPRVEE